MTRDARDTTIFLIGVALGGIAGVAGWGWLAVGAAAAAGSALCFFWLVEA